MSDTTCEVVRPLLPDWVANALEQSAAESVRLHVLACEQCRSESETLRALLRARPVPPEHLAARIQQALRADRPAIPPAGSGDAQDGRSPGFFGWLGSGPAGLAAAAVVVLALGTAVIWPQVRDRVQAPGPEASPVSSMLLDSWSGDDGIIAGAPVLEELTDEQLLTLLEELGG
jgi:hypothetical protein